MKMTLRTSAARALGSLFDRAGLHRGRAAAESRPMRGTTAGDLRTYLRAHPPDDTFLADIRFGRGLPDRLGTADRRY